MVQLRYSCGTAAVQLWYCWVLLWYCGTSYSEILGEILGENIAKESTHHKRCIRRETCNEGSYHEQVISESLALLVGAGHHQIMEYLP